MFFDTSSRYFNHTDINKCIFNKCLLSLCRLPYVSLFYLYICLKSTAGYEFTNIFLH